MSINLFDWPEWLRPLIEGRMALKQYLLDGGHPVLWRLAHYLTDAKTALGCLLPALLFERLAPATPTSRDRRWHLVFDWCYPLFAIGLLASVVVPTVFAIRQLAVAALPAGPAAAIAELPAGVQFLVAFLLQDFTRYVSHLARHKIPWFWHFHAVHHSQEHMNPLTTQRSHPLEAVTGAFITALPVALIGVEPLPWFYAGVTSLLWDMAIHANWRTNFGPLGAIFVSPQFHHVHHSRRPEHIDRNFGERLVIRDWMFGTMEHDRTVYPETGCPESAAIMERPGERHWILRGVARQWVSPFRAIGASLRRGWRRRVAPHDQPPSAEEVALS